MSRSNKPNRVRNSQEYLNYQAEHLHREGDLDSCLVIGTVREGNQLNVISGSFGVSNELLQAVASWLENEKRRIQ